MREVLKLEHAYRTVPQDRLGRENNLLPVVQALLGSVHALPAVRNLVNGEYLTRSVVLELLAADGSNREREVYTLLFGSLDDVQSLRHEVILVQRVADMTTLSLDEGVTHTTTDDEVVDLVEEVLDDTELRADL